MGIFDGIVEWIAEQVMNGLDLISTSVLGSLGCSMDTFFRTPALKFRKLQLCPAHYSQFLRQRFRISYRVDSRADTCMELYQTAL